MARKTVRHILTTPEWIENINPDNKELIESFLDYLSSTSKSKGTIDVYKSDLNIAFCWCLNNIKNKSFIEWSKRDVQKYQKYLVEDCELGSARVRRLKACLSSMSNYIENILDDEYPDFRNIINKIESPPKDVVREKTVLSEEEVDKLLNTLVEKKDYRKACFIALAAFSGRRKAELCRFKVSDFDEEHLVCDGALYKSDPIKTKGRGVKGKMLECYVLAKDFKPYFDMWMKFREENGIESQWLFFDREDNGEQLTTSAVDSWYPQLSKLIGTDFYCHCLRHYFTSRLIRLGIPLNVIKDIVQWESIEMVNLYNDVPSEEGFSKYFGADGIKEVKEGTLNDL